MNREEFLEYIEKNFTVSGEAKRLIDNILFFVKEQEVEEDKQYLMLCELLDGTIGLSDSEIRKIVL